MKKERSCFPINPDLAKRVMTPMIQTPPMSDERGLVIGNVLESMSIESPEMAFEITKVVHELEEDLDENFAEKYMLGATTVYQVIKEQSKESKAYFPTVSKKVIDAYERDIFGLDQKKDIRSSADIVSALLENLSEKDERFHDVLKNYAPFYYSFADEEIFLRAALDMHGVLHKAENTEKTMRAIGVTEKDQQHFDDIVEKWHEENGGTI